MVELSDGIQNFKNRFSFVSESLTTGSLISENHAELIVYSLNVVFTNICHYVNYINMRRLT